MNILQMEDTVKGLPDQQLMQMAQQPTGEFPQFLLISEAQRRSDMRKRYEQQKPENQGTIAEQILNGGIGSLGQGQQQPPPQQPPQGQMPPQGMPPQGAPPMPPQGAPMPPQQMYAGGQVNFRTGGYTGSEYDDELHTFSQLYGINADVLKGQMQAESRGDPNATSGAAHGLMQLTTGTAGDMGIDPENIYDPTTNIAGGA